MSAKPAPPSAARVLVVEDILPLMLSFREVLAELGAQCMGASSEWEAQKALEKSSLHVALVDMDLEEEAGLGVVRLVRERQPNCLLLVLAGERSGDLARQALELGANDYLTKPVTTDRLRLTLKNSLESARMKSVMNQMEATGRYRFHSFIGTSPAMQAIYRMIETVAQSKAPVFVLGESGTGKELCAEAIHRSSPRRDKPFIAINCAAIPKDLMESEVFGHVKGAFTGATADRDGAALMADGGTLFLDELCEMDINLQAKLLRLLQTGEVRRVGESRVQRVDIRVIAATNRDPFLEVEEGRFREDLYYRLFVLPIELPPLRERGPDIGLIAQTMLLRYAAEENKPAREFAPEAQQVLVRHRWPGNVRELLNVVRAAVIFSSGPVVAADVVRRTIERSGRAMGGTAVAPAVAESTIADTPRQIIDFTASTFRPLADLEREAIERAMQVFGGNMTRAADALGINTSTLYRKLKSWAQGDDTPPRS